MISKFLVALLATASSTFMVGAVSLPFEGDIAIADRDLSTSQSPGLSTRDGTWDEYNKNTEDMVKNGLCRHYIDNSIRDNLVMCQRYCKSNSVSCIYNGAWKTDPSTLHRNPDNERYTYGKCDCNTDLATTLTNIIMEGSEQAGPIICEVWLESFYYAAQILETLALPAKVPIKAFKAIVKVVGTANSIAGQTGLTTVNDLITKACGSDVIKNQGKLGLLKDGYNLLKNFDTSKLKGQ